MTDHACFLDHRECGADPRHSAIRHGFYLLATAASVEAIFLSTFVLISQNRAAADADRRADLDLHVNLLSEHEITHMFKLVKALAAKAGFEKAEAPYLEELTSGIKPEQVLDRLEPEGNDGEPQ